MLFPTLFLPFLLTSKEATSQLGLLVTYSQGAAYYTFLGVNVAERDVLGASLCRKRSF